MFSAFFVVAARAPGRQLAFRSLLTLHLTLLLGCTWLVYRGSSPAYLGLGLLALGIVEGALLIGWRLTQLPKSQALEFLLVSPLRPRLVFLAEASVGLLRLALLTLSGLPLFLLLSSDGRLLLADLWPLLVLPWSWGAVTGLVLTAWAYEPLLVRRWAERGLMLLILFYLVVGILAGEHLKVWLDGLPLGIGQFIIDGFHGFHAYNPFAVMAFALEQPPDLAWVRLQPLLLVTLILIVLAMLRGAWRLQSHFQERHYRPITLDEDEQRAPIGDWPLSWWAVKRVTEYAGRSNLWLAGGFGLLYALHLLAGDHWPAWMGRKTFQIVDQFFGVAGLTTALAVLATVPAAFQYGLWDSSPQDRCRRLELLLLTHLDGRDYWHAAEAAAWQRGRGYFVVAVVLWLAGIISGHLTPLQGLGAWCAAVALWRLYFVLGFRAFSSGMAASNLGLLLTVALPLGTMLLHTLGTPALAALTPPGMVYYAARASGPAAWLAGVLLAVGATWTLQHQALSRCLHDLQSWYEKYHGQSVRS